MSTAVSPKIYELLKNAVGINIDNYSIVLRGSNQKGAGNLSEMDHISLKDKASGKVLELVVKQAFTDEKARSYQPVRSYYLNEIYFYDKVWSSFQKFQRGVPSAKAFDKVPRCFATSSEDKSEKLVLENLRYQNFVVFDRKRPFDKEHLEYILTQLGKFHGISLAYKELNPEEYLEASNGLKELWSDVCELPVFKHHIKYIHEVCLENLDPEEDAKVIKRYKEHAEDCEKTFYDSTVYKGKYSVVLHGDYWSNNMMFKYDESKKVVDMRLLDFQFSNVGTPASDLAYCIYSGASKEVLDDLDYYLKVYHNSLLDTVKDFGCDPENVYPFEELKKEWKQHCKMGFTMGLMLWRGKLTDEGEIKDLTDMKDDSGTDYTETKYDEDTFKKITRDIILHLYKNDFL